MRHRDQLVRQPGEIRDPARLKDARMAFVTGGKFFKSIHRKPY
jgi:hypothetical protein